MKYYGKCVLPVGTYWSYGMNSFPNMRVAVQTDLLPERTFTIEGEISREASPLLVIRRQLVLAARFPVTDGQYQTSRLRTGDNIYDQKVGLPVK